MKKALTIIYSMRFFIICAIILGLFSLTLLQIQAISAPSTDSTYLKKQRENLKAEQISIDSNLKEQIEKLTETPVDVAPKNLGSQDPFNP